MNNRTTEVYSPNKYQFEIISGLSIHILIEENRYQLPLETVFSMAARLNKKRSFLFVSHLLGKHTPVHPLVPLESSRLLAQKFCELLELDTNQTKWTLPEAMTFIGFAETATALGHAVYDQFTNASYIHTTRETLIDRLPVFTFEEEHSHATAHRCYAEKTDLFTGDRPIVLIDDECTTGKTMVNMIQALHNQFPRKQYYVLTLLDWRSTESKQLFASVMEELGIHIEVISLITGTIDVVGAPTCDLIETIKVTEGHKPNLSFHTLSAPKINLTSVNGLDEINQAPFLSLTGRFGLAPEDQALIDSLVTRAGETLQSVRTGKQTLCLGTGEFMYVPLRIAGAMGEGVSYQSTTRSPIHAVNRTDYAIRYKYSFPNPEDASMTYYVYNIPPGKYDEIFLFFERPISEEKLNPIIAELAKAHIKEIHIVSFK